MTVTLPHVWAKIHAEQTPGAPAVVFDTSTLSYGELDRQADAHARQLRDAGIGEGDLVAIDAALGVPVGYGLQTGLADFPETLDWLDRQGALAKSIRDPEQWRHESPFFAVNAGVGGLTRYSDQAGGRAAG